jgi:hypothetical protein
MKLPYLIPSFVTSEEIVVVPVFFTPNVIPKIGGRAWNNGRREKSFLSEDNVDEFERQPHDGSAARPFEAVR